MYYLNILSDLLDDVVEPPVTAAEIFPEQVNVVDFEERNGCPRKKTGLDDGSSWERPGSGEEGEGAWVPKRGETSAGA